jgi:hypothetical protein
VERWKGGRREGKHTAFILVTEESHRISPFPLMSRDILSFPFPLPLSYFLFPYPLPLPLPFPVPFTLPLYPFPLPFPLPFPFPLSPFPFQLHTRPYLLGESKNTQKERRHLLMLLLYSAKGGITASLGCTITSNMLYCKFSHGKSCPTHNFVRVGGKW